MTIFGDEGHRAVLKRGADVPEQPPEFPIPLGHVGIANTVAWVDLGEGRRPYRVEVGVALPRDRRGIHMSRIRAVLRELSSRSFPHLGLFVEEAARRVAGVQAGGQAQVEARGQEPLATRGPVSGAEGLEAREVGAWARWSRQGVERAVWLTATHITACPCTQEYCRHLPGMEGASLGGHPLHITHSQRAVTTLRLRGMDSPMAPAELAPVMAQALHLTQDLLKRPDEAELVARAHLEPQFVEDAVRAVAAGAWRRFRGLLPPHVEVEVEAVSLESIHSHDVVCRFSATLEELGGHLNTTVQEVSHEAL